MLVFELAFKMQFFEKTAYEKEFRNDCSGNRSGTVQN